MPNSILEKLEETLEFLQNGANVAEKILPDGSTPDMAARAVSLLAGIAAAAVHSHNQVADVPLEINRLHELPHV